MKNNNTMLDTSTPSEEKKRYIVETHYLESIASYNAHANKIMNIANELAPDFQIEPKDGSNLKWVYRNALYYFNGDKRSEFDLNKGLFLYGDVGSGKSLLFDIFKEYTKHQIQCNSFVKHGAVNIIADINKHGQESMDKYITSNQDVILLVDDFGTGEMTITHYGTKINVMTELLLKRYVNFNRNNSLTHMSSNIRPEEIEFHFDARITSRLAEMVNTIEIIAPDFRIK